MALSIYNTLKYNQGLYYGRQSYTADALWGIWIKWDDTTYENHGYNAVKLSITRGRDVMMSGGEWERYRPGKAEITLDNEDDQYNPYNASSPLYGNVVPGKFVKIAVRDNATGTDYPLMAGKIYDIRPYFDGKRKYAQLSIVDGIDYLNNASVTAGWFNSIDGMVRMLTLVTESGWPTADWPVNGSFGPDLGDTYFFKRNAAAALNEMADAMAAQWFHHADGSYKAYSAAYTHADTTDIDESDCLRDITISQPWDQIANQVRIWQNNKLSVGTGSDTMWSNGQPIPISAGQTLIFDAMFRIGEYYPVGCTTISANLVTFDVNTQEDGLGTDITASCSFTIDPSTEAGEGTVATIHNGSASNGYIITAEIIGSGLAIVNPAVWENNHAGSQAIIGVRKFELNCRWIQGALYAIAYRDWVLDEFYQSRRSITIKLENQFPLQFGVDLYINRIHFTAPSLGIDTYFRVGKIKHEWLIENGQHVLTTLTLEPYLTALTLPDQPT